MMNPQQTIDTEATAATKARYDRIAPLYDLVEGLMEMLFVRQRRRFLWQNVSPAGGILEIGVGTGENMPYYPQAAQITAIDLSGRMLARAHARAAKLGFKIELLQMDAQALTFPNNTFDAVVASFVFCSVPDPLLGFHEIKRVLRPGGKAFLLEHMRPHSAWLGKLFDLLNPLIVRLWGANINRRTVENVRRSGLEIERIDCLSVQGIVRLIIAKAGKE